MIRGLEIEFGRAVLQLLPERAILWPDRRTLLVADVHVGKEATFASLGVPVPAGISMKDLMRLSTLIEKTSARRLIILGDLLHARILRHPELLEGVAAWRNAHADIQMLLVPGNHDRSSGSIPPSWNLEICPDNWEEAGFAFSHAPPESPRLPTFAGHIHPKFLLQDYDRSLASAPCFVCDEKCLILPSFGTFTGGYHISPEPGRRIFIAAPNRVVLIPD